MKSLFAFIKKEWIESVRSGKFIYIVILFILFGIMSPAIAKLTPWMMELKADSLAEAGLIVTEVSVDALTSWTQYFKNIPIGLIAFVLIYSNIFTKEYQSQSLVLVFTKGLSRYKVVLAKSTMMLLLWTLGYYFCFAITYIYNSYFWDNTIVHNLLPAVVYWWLFGVWVISLIVLFSVILKNNTGVLLGTGGAVLTVYLAGLLPKLREYMPTMLMDTSSLLSDATGAGSYMKAVIVTGVLSVVFVAASVPVMNKREI